MARESLKPLEYHSIESLNDDLKSICDEWRFTNRHSFPTPNLQRLTSRPISESPFPSTWRNPATAD